MDTLDMDSIQEVMLSLFDQLCMYSPGSDEYEAINQIAFGYYHLIRRYQDVDETFDIKGRYNHFLFVSMYE